MLNKQNLFKLIRFLFPEKKTLDKFVLLEEKNGNLFWTIDDGTSFESNGLKIIYKGTNPNEMVDKWCEYFELTKKKKVKRSLEDKTLH